MKKILLFLICMMASFAMQAQQQKQEVVWGYSNDTFSPSPSVPEEHAFKCAMRMPASVLKMYKGCTITCIEVGTANVVRELVPVISLGGDENYAAQASRTSKPG